MPYHEERRFADSGGWRADHAVSANLGRTLFAVRQAVADLRRARAWLAAEGYGRVGLVGTSLGSCVSFLALAHEPRFPAAVFHHVSSHFGDVVWRGISTAHVRRALEEGGVTRAFLQRAWAPISPIRFVGRMTADCPVLMITARYDLTFPIDLSVRLHRAYRERGLPHETWITPWGHYTSGRLPFVAILVRRVLAYLDAHL